MPVSPRMWLAAAVLVICQAPACPQQAAAEPAKPFAPKQALTADERSHRDALELYGRAMLCERNNRLLEATRLLERAVRLDQKSALLHRALVPLYLAQDRANDALSASRKALDLDPDDYETWYVYARQLRERGRAKEAIDAFVHAVGCPGLKRHADLLAQMYFDLGILYEEAPDAARAEAAYLQVANVLSRVRRKPEAFSGDGPVSREDVDAKLGEAYERLISVCLDNRHYDVAIATFEDARAKGLAHSGRLDYQLARVYLGKGKPAEALRHLDEYLKTQPTGTEGYELRTTLLKRLGRHEDVLPSLKYYADHDARNVALQLLLARQYSLAGQEKAAEDKYTSLANDSPSPDVYRGLFNLYNDQRRMAEALTLFDEALKKAGAKDSGAAAKARAMLVAFRDSSDLAKELVTAALDRLRTGTLESETQHFLAVLAARSHQLDAAETLYRDCLNSPLAPQTERDTYVGLLDVLWKAHKRDAIVEVCKKGLTEAKATPLTLFHEQLARALALLGKADEAVAEADRVVALTAGDGRVLAHLFRAEILQQVERYDKAIAECRGLLKDATKPAELHDIHYTLSGVYSAAHELPKAEEQLRWLLEKDPNDVGANNDLGYLLAEQGKDLKEAEEMIRKAIRLDRERRKLGTKVGEGDDHDNAAYVDSLGWVFFRRGQLEAARRELEKATAIKDGGDDPVIWDHLGDVYFRLDQMEKAKTVWRKAIRLYESQTSRKPDEQYKEIKQKLKLLEPKEQP